MYRDDYIVRMFTEFAKALGAILKLKLDKDYDKAEIYAQETLQKFSQSTINFLLSIDEQELVIELTERKKLSLEQLQVVAELLYQTGEIREAREVNESGIRYYCRSLEIFKFIAKTEKRTFNIEVMQRISYLETIVNSS